MTENEIFMYRALQLASNGIGITRPNPSVGAVIVYDHKIIGEGFTSAYGGYHAEVAAINSVKDKTVLKKSTLYVTLEPCSHYGKTPPCADLIVANQIPKVVIGCLDSNVLVSGKGISRLKEANCEVTLGVLETLCKEHHRRFFCMLNNKRPYVILKWAKTKDGFIAPLTKEKQKPVWISNEYSKQLAHKLRSKEHAILVGANTVFADDPLLTTRSWGGQDPIRVVIDKYLNIPKDYAIFNDGSKVIVITSDKLIVSQNTETISYEKINFDNPLDVACQILDVLYRYNIQSVLVEGGSKTLQQFIDANLWDEAVVFTGNSTFGKGVGAPKFDILSHHETNIGDDTMSVYNNS